MTKNKPVRKKILITRFQRLLSSVCLGIAFLFLVLLVVSIFGVFGSEFGGIYTIILYSFVVGFFLIWTPILVPNRESLIIIAEVGIIIFLLLHYIS